MFQIETSINEAVFCYIILHPTKGPCQHLCFSLLVNVFIFDFVLPGGGTSTSPSCAPFLDRLAAELSFLQYSEGDNGGSCVGINSKMSNDRLSDDVEMPQPFDITMGVDSTMEIGNTPKGKLVCLERHLHNRCLNFLLKLHKNWFC